MNSIIKIIPKPVTFEISENVHSIEFVGDIILTQNSQGAQTHLTLLLPEKTCAAFRAQFNKEDSALRKLHTRGSTIFVADGKGTTAPSALRLKGRYFGYRCIVKGQLFAAFIDDEDVGAVQMLQDLKFDDGATTVDLNDLLLQLTPANVVEYLQNDFVVAGLWFELTENGLEEFKSKNIDGRK
eukprot:GHVS01032806.1.p1 GENE.GHVS01032806.1~~GHVS01032806.1.p1  ORF type:complete len:183 (-),score=18.67 GHVS01032806.1:219-767(-)